MMETLIWKPGRKPHVNHKLKVFHNSPTSRMVPNHLSESGGCQVVASFGLMLSCVYGRVHLTYQGSFSDHSLCE